MINDQRTTAQPNPRPTIAIALAENEASTVELALALAGHDTVRVKSVAELAELLRSNRDVAVTILDGDADPATLGQFHGLLHEGGKAIPALIVASREGFERLPAELTERSMDDEFFSRPFEADALRWRVEAMLIRSQTPDVGPGPIFESGPGMDAVTWAKRATVVAVFNPKGGVGKTTVSTNLAAALQVHRGQRVLLVDADTVTGHIAISLGVERFQTASDAWADDLLERMPVRPFAQLVFHHASGVDLVVLTSHPFANDALEPERVADAIVAARRGYDFVVVDTHSSYSPLNLAILEVADRVLMPITPDIPALRAGMQLAHLAADLEIADKLAMVVNRANSGVTVADTEKAVGLPTLAQIRSSGLLFVKAANEGTTVVERFPSERVTQDIDALADSLLRRNTRDPVADGARANRQGFRLFGRAKQPARA